MKKGVLELHKVIAIICIWGVAFGVFTCCAYGDNSFLDKMNSRQVYSYGADWTIPSTYSSVNENTAISHIEMLAYIETRGKRQPTEVDTDLELQGPKSEAKEIKEEITGSPKESGLNSIGDADNNGIVDDNDIQILLDAWDEYVYDEAGNFLYYIRNYNPDADFNKDGYVDGQDLSTLISGWGKQTEGYGNPKLMRSFTEYIKRPEFSVDVRAIDDDKYEYSDAESRLTLWDLTSSPQDEYTAGGKDLFNTEKYDPILERKQKEDSYQYSYFAINSEQLGQGTDDMENSKSNIADGDIADTIAQAAELIISEQEYINEDTKKQLQEVFRTVKMIRRVMGIIEHADFKGIEDALGTLVSEHTELYGNYVEARDKVYKQLGLLLDINIDEIPLSDEYVVLDKMTLGAKRKVIIDLAMKRVSGNESEVTDKKREALLVYSSILKLEKKYQEGINTIFDRFIFEVKKAFTDISPVSIAEDEGKFSGLFLVGSKK